MFATLRVKLAVSSASRKRSLGFLERASSEVDVALWLINGDDLFLQAGRGVLDVGYELY